MNWELLQNSLLVSMLAAVLGLLFGAVTALWLACLEARWRNVWLGISILALVLPPFLITNCWLHFLGYTGVWRDWLPLNIYSLGGTIWVLALLVWPISLIAILGAWSRLNAALLETDTALNGGRLIRFLLLPVARPAAGLALVIGFVLALNNFAVPAILQTRVFPAELWVRFNTTFDYAGAAQLSWPLVLGPLLLLVGLRGKRFAWPERSARFPAAVLRRQLGQAWFGGCAAGGLSVLFLSVGLPLAQLFGNGRTWNELLPALAAGQSALLHSLGFAVITATAVSILGLLTWRWRVGVLTWLPFLVPGVLLGIGLILALNRPGLGALLSGATGVVLALALRYWALGWSGARLAMSGVAPALSDWARLNGASRWQLFREVQWPQIAPQILAFWYLTYLLCLWEVEILVLVVPPGGETLALRVFNLLHYGHNAHVNAICALLLGLALLPILAWGGFRLLQRSRGACGTALCPGGTACLVMAFVLGCQPAAPEHETPVKSELFRGVQVIGSRGAGLGQFNKPRSVAVDRDDNLYVVDMTGRVQKFSPDGIFLSSWQLTQTELGRPKGMCQDQSGNVIVIEPHYSRVNHYSPDGELLARWGDHGRAAGQLAFPRAAAINSRGEIYVSEYGIVERVQRFGPGGASFLNAFGAAGNGPGEFNRPEGVGIGPGDRLYVADSCNHRVQVFSPEGTFLASYGQAGTGAGELSYPYDVRVDAAGRQYVCEFGNSRIQIFDADHRPVERLGGPGAAPGQFSNPWAITLDSAGNLYVADSANHRVQKFMRKSVVRSQWSVAKNHRPRTTDHGLLTTD